MKISSFSVEKFRSITRSEKIYLKDYTVLVGPNNEGKSNILRALYVALNSFPQHAIALTSSGGKIFFEPLDTDLYVWSRDFPIQMQERDAKAKSSFIIEFDFDKKDIEAFRREFKTTINGLFGLRLEFDSKSKISFFVSKQGLAGKRLEKRAQEVAYFIRKRFEVQYIPAVRTADKAIGIVDRMVDQELAALELNEAYKNALKTIAELQQPVFVNIGNQIKESLIAFLPSVKKVIVKISSDKRRRALRATQIIVDDGTPTELSLKGDGVQSLAALSLLRSSHGRAHTDRNLIVAIEEPEAHLHPRAITYLKDTIKKVAAVGGQQVIVATHSPLLIERDDQSSNIIVTNSRATVAKNIGEIRDALGVAASDNLTSAEQVLLVEGEEDKIFLTAVLREKSKKLASALGQSRLVIQKIRGASKLSYHISIHRSMVCGVFIFFDNDDAARESIRVCKLQNSINESEYMLANCANMKNSEIEDFLDPEAYVENLNKAFGVLLSKNDFMSTKQKWTNKAKSAFQKQGKMWDDQLEIQAKKIVSAVIGSRGLSALMPNRGDVLDVLTKAIENRLKS